MENKTVSYSKLTGSFQKILPLVDDLADALGVILIVALALSLWIFIYCFQLQQLSLIISLMLSGLTLLPSLVLSRIWYALESLKDIPKVAEEIIDDVTDETAQSWHATKSGKKGALNFFRQVKKLFEIRTLLNSADDIMGQYFSIGPLVNPFYLFLSALSFLGLFFLVVTSVILALLTVIF
ncbi:MAG: hypothetical protein methR_P0740 [Methyloprofundus sp.]|nr:MAG: hypothetical protein methR_P0740 [Methyloprofundus sp.]